MKVVFVISLIFVGAFCATSVQQTILRDLYDQWKTVHNKAFQGGLNDELRFQVFAENYMSILEFNAMQDDVVLGLNQFADLTRDEFREQYTGYNPARRNSVGVAPVSTDLPDNWDWRKEGAVNPVKNQGACGSCWAFSAVGSLEGLYFIDSKKLIHFSEQQLVDCVKGQSEGCNGGYMSDAFEYTAEYGIEPASDYPYTARTEQCKYDSSKAIRVNTGYLNVTAQSAEALKSAITQVPVAVAVQADQLVFQFYKVGVIKALCGDDLNHGITAVGYDNIGGTEAFIVKNSWGSSWGQNGYVYISTDEKPNGGNGVCGILADNCYPTN